MVLRRFSASMTQLLTRPALYRFAAHERVPSPLVGADQGEGASVGSLDKARAVFFHGVSKEEDMTGTIKKIVKERGFGFITSDEGAEEVFFHRSRLAPKVYFEDLREGDEVEFQVRPGEKGPQAFNLKLR